MKENKASLIIIKAVLCILMLLTLVSCKKVENTQPLPETVPVSDKQTENRTGKRIYFAAPLFSQGEKDYNLIITHILEDYGYEVFLPQRDGFLAPELEGKSEKELVDIIFSKDYEEIMKSDILFVLLDGRVPDEGACVELGIAYGAGKRCYGIKSDPRVVESNLDLNPMISGCLIELFEDFDGDALIEKLKQYLSENEL